MVTIFTILVSNIRSDTLFRKIGIRKGYVFEASIARPRAKSGQVQSPGFWQLPFGSANDWLGCYCHVVLEILIKIRVL